MQDKRILSALLQQAPTWEEHPNLCMALTNDGGLVVHPSPRLQLHHGPLRALPAVKGRLVPALAALLDCVAGGLRGGNTR
jgi:hypothetical protein